MSPPRRETEGAGTGFDGFLVRLTGRVGKITGLVLALGTLGVALHKQFPAWPRLFGGGQATQQACIQVDRAAFPEMLSLGEWDNTRIRVSGHNKCAEQFGLYMTFRRELSEQPLFSLRSPHADVPECNNGLAADHLPQCWISQKPIATGAGEWEWRVQLPRVERLRDIEPGENIRISWTVRNYDEPTKPVMRAETATIRLRN